jgi:hypothetical protein
VAGKIFINYRRDDSIGMAGRLHDRLAQTFGRDAGLYYGRNRAARFAGFSRRSTLVRLGHEYHFHQPFEPR